MAWSNAKNSALKERALKVIPRGMYGHEATTLLPDEYPQFFQRAKGSRLWDVDGNEYVDMMCAYGPNLLGYGYEPVEAAAAAQQVLGDTMTGPSEGMVTLAETLVGMISHADWAMFCKNGTDATTMAIVAARAHTGRRKILYATGTYHGAAPWCTPRPAGTLPEDRAHIVYYQYNDLDSLEAAFKACGGDVAGVLATPFVHEVFRDQTLAEQAFARGARELCDKYGALLILDEVRAGFRLARDCSWAQYGVAPDLSAWGKCLANGYPISALLGSEAARRGAEEMFVTGSFWFSATPMAAAIETLRQIRDTDYLERTIASGRRLREGLQQQAASHGFTLRQTGPAQMPQILFEDDPDFRIGYAWAAEALKGGAYLHPYHNMFVSGAHTLDDMGRILEATDQAFEAVKKRRDTLQPHPILTMILNEH
ncbi:aminotransferase class III-fold pyridoxal phosphate-dependent enzyme [Phenylobacterium sp.]|uniref:aminotransferase class III-fold pyridoxal phosphate-dependent enzyme n=1 Tax=Phenylobacterium sp. TaxID=1871053 RepID=UPI002C018D65|nr:aminotransferase class III-fold pyridoxal phosphate-dependent enzyme [Phenylobacterium sp.]HVI33609.1 aminotransferase class III-fold pyridoxal phosphate-dependent enzyme [Phenylobacterium sp.]